VRGVREPSGIVRGEGERFRRYAAASRPDASNRRRCPLRGHALAFAHVTRGHRVVRARPLRDPRGAGDGYTSASRDAGEGISLLIPRADADRGRRRPPPSARCSRNRSHSGLRSSVAVARGSI
jgi:hypothetical protein